MPDAVEGATGTIVNGIESHSLARETTIKCISKTYLLSATESEGCYELIFSGGLKRRYS